MRNCIKCGREYKYSRQDRKGATATRCNSCVTYQRKLQRKKDLVAYKGGVCMRCGFNKFVEALCFHHRNPSLKKFTINQNYNRAWIKLLEEVDKCDLLCLNCHAEIHTII